MPHTARRGLCSGGMIGGDYTARERVEVTSDVGSDSRRDHDIPAYRQSQRLAQCRQVPVAWPNAIVLPKVDARRADTNLFSDFNHRQSTLDASVTKIARVCEAIY
jgi:hypothetical protein